MPLVEMYFGKGALTDEQKADLSRKVTDLIVKEAKQRYSPNFLLCETSFMLGDKDKAKKLGLITKHG